MASLTVEGSVYDALGRVTRREFSEDRLTMTVRLP